MPGYGVATLGWSVTPSPGAPPQTFSGTLQEIRAQLLDINPNFDHDFPPVNKTDRRDSSRLIHKRDTPNCQPGHGWTGALQQTVVDGINYLRSVPGQPANGPGPGNCGRVSCAYDSAIWWCNYVSQASRLSAGQAGKTSLTGS